MFGIKPTHLLYFILLIPLLLISTLLISISLNDRANAEELRLTRLITRGAYDIVDAVGFEFLGLASHLTTDMYSQIEEEFTWSLAMIDNAIASYETIARFPQLLDEVAILVEDMGEVKYLIREKNIWIESESRPSWYNPESKSSFTLENPVIPVPLSPGFTRIFQNGLTPRVFLIRIRVDELIERIIPTYANDFIQDSYLNSSFSVEIFHIDTSTQEDRENYDTFVPLLPWQDLRSWFDLYRIRNENVQRPIQNQTFSIPGRDPGSSRSGSWYLGISREPQSITQHMMVYRWTNRLITLMYLLIMSAATASLYLSFVKTERNLDYERTITGLITHELKTPLAVLTTLTENIQGNYVTPESLKHYAPLIHGQTKRLHAIVDKTITIGQIQSLEHRPKGDLVNVTQVIQEILALHKNESRNKGVIFNFEHHESIQITGDKVTIVMVLDNLITNALDYGTNPEKLDKGNIITIQVARHGRTFKPGVLVTIEDQGPGIPPNERAHIFKPYFRGFNAQEKQVQGSGLGLYLVASIMKNLGGKISLNRHTKSGAKFETWFPGKARG